MSVLFCDLETYSPVPIGNGTHAYAEEAEVLLFPYAFDDDPPSVWDLTDPATPYMPEDLAEGLNDPSVMTVWHNGAMFDKVLLRHALGIDLPIERIHDTMVQAYAHGLPGSLATLCNIFKLPEELSKLKTGKQLILLFCKPLPKNQKTRRATRDTHPKEWAAFIDYAKGDIPSMRELYKRMPTWNYTGKERELWHLDNKMNERGIAVDTELAERAIEAIENAQKILDARTKELTEDEVSSARKRDVLLQHLIKTFGIDIPDMRAATLEKAAEDESLPWALRELLQIRIQTALTSTSKYKTLLKGVSKDGRLRGLLQFCGATRTGRWSGRLFQPQNLPRPQHGQEEIDDAILRLKEGTLLAPERCNDLVEQAREVMRLCSSAIRGCLIAPPGKKLVFPDLSNIEGRVAAWLADETWKPRAFEAYDLGIGHDLYILAYAKAFRVEPETVAAEYAAGVSIKRMIGKVMELALQYAGGVGAIVTFAMSFGIDLDELAEGVWPSLPLDIKDETAGHWEWATRKHLTFDLNEKTFRAIDGLKRLWRRAHPATSCGWKVIENAAKHAVRTPGVLVPAKGTRLAFYRNGAWLRMRLPSGRFLCYAQPHIDPKDDSLKFMGQQQVSRRWGVVSTHGGKLFENACQAVARDVMAHNMPLIDAAGYKLCLSVHDELIAEAPDTDNFTAGAMSDLLAATPPWATGLPLAATGHEAQRYHK